MESKISLAIATKLKMIFEKEGKDKFLTFPLGTGFTYRYLNFMKDPSISGLTLQEHLNNKGDFARQLNIIPNDSVIYTPDASRFLWDELKGVLHASVFAQSALTDSENNRLNEAIDFLTDFQKQEDGTEVPVYSVPLKKYYEYRDIYKKAEETYLDEKITVENTMGPEGETLKHEWSSYREKQFLDLKNKAYEDWKNLGFKEQIEYYQSLRIDLEVKKFLNIYRKNYLDDINISEIPDLNSRGIGIYTTFYSPFDAFDENLPWTKINLTKDEINNLIQNSIPELKTVFHADQGENNIEAISLEYNNVVIMRPWFKPEFFESRYWRLSDNSVISDGNLPRIGKIPAYISSMIMVRNINITRKKNMEQKPFNLSILKKTVLQSFKIKEPIKPIDLTTHTRTEMKVNPLFAKNFILAKSVGTTIKSKVFTLPARHISSFTETTSAGLTAPAPKSDLITESYNLDGVAVLAFVCKRVPKSPDPDDSLIWD